jgi:RNA polymerase sigma-70 factor, ECF subfamily
LTEAIERLLERARQGDAEALSVLYQRFLPGIFGYIATRVPDRSTAEDLTSEVFLHMVEGIHRLKATDETGFAAWLMRIAHVAVASHYRTREKQPPQVPLFAEEGEERQVAGFEMDPADWIEAREEWFSVVRAINSLTEEQRQVLVGRLILGYDVAAVARLIGKKTNAVKALQFRALHRLQQLVGTPRALAYSRQRNKEERR